MFEIYSNHGKLLDRKHTLDEAYRCFRDWPQASFVISRGDRIVLHREDVDQWEMEQRRKSPMTDVLDAG